MSFERHSGLPFHGSMVSYQKIDNLNRNFNFNLTTPGVSIVEVESYEV